MDILHKNLKFLLPAMVIVLLYGCSSPSEKRASAEVPIADPAKDWVDLFDGKSLDGWTQKNGAATYQVQGGLIVGKTSEGSPNSFLCSEKNYDDFELTFEVKVDKGLNSGVQIRSTTRETTVGDDNNQQAGRVIGPQVEIVEGDEDGSLSGYIWREATGDGWMISKGEPVEHKYFKGGEWNKYRILAKSNRITTWINGNQVEDVTDQETYNKFPTGFIGLQVHGIGKGAGPFQVAWKNIRIKVL